MLHEGEGHAQCHCTKTSGSLLRLLQHPAVWERVHGGMRAKPPYPLPPPPPPPPRGHVALAPPHLTGGSAALKPLDLSSCTKGRNTWASR